MVIGFCFEVDGGGKVCAVGIRFLEEGLICGFWMAGDGYGWMDRWMEREMMLWYPVVIEEEEQPINMFLVFLPWLLESLKGVVSPKVSDCDLPATLWILHLSCCSIPRIKTLPIISYSWMATHMIQR